MMKDGNKKVLIISGVMMALVFLLEILFVHPHGYFWWHELLAFDLLFGLVGCLVLIFAAKVVVRTIVERNEDYYDGGGSDDA